MKLPNFEFNINYELLAVVLVSAVTFASIFNAVILNTSPAGFATGTVYVNVSCTTSIIMLNNNVSFGTIDRDTSNDTTDNIPLPFRIRNDGNVAVNITLTANSSLFSNEAPSPNIYFQAACGNVTEERNCSTAETNAWSNIPLTPTTILKVVNLSFTNTVDEIEIDINVTVPNNVSAGGKSATLTFTGIDNSGTICP
ncbi:MAG TPA: hypothetical protein HA224_04905 [Nanoarchaeota archaeon]|nr:hypothetical protein [Nanoarchaeota archaeon]